MVQEEEVLGKAYDGRLMRRLLGYLTPYRAGDEQQFVATVFEMTRLPADFPTGWIPPQR